MSTAEAEARKQERFLTDRQKAWMTHRSFRNRFESEAVLDFGDLITVELKQKTTTCNLSKQSGTKSTMSERHSDKNIGKSLLDEAREITRTEVRLQVFVQETTIKKEAYHCDRRKQCVETHLEQKLSYPNVKTRSKLEEKPILGEAVTGKGKGKDKVSNKLEIAQTGPPKANDQ